ncbi:glycosyltransferase family 8 protein [Micromonospora sp. NPDC049230]|uniref:glycosyltransferase family 8 protein n=1 Tax=Micromonospora sp. NPDC049230 TaxID=3155502 RepID=UPI0034100568
MDIHILLAVDDNYVPGAAVLAHSARAELRDADTRLVFHVIDCDLSTERRAELGDLLGRSGQVRFHRISDRLGLHGPSLWYSDAAVARLHVAEVIPPDVQRLLYLDADMLVLEDLTALYTVDLGGNALGAVLNGFAPSRSLVITDEGARQIQTGAVPPGHFNSGVLLMDMRRWRADGISERAIEMHRRYGADTTHADQDILNHICAGRWTPLPEKWNKMIAHPVLGKFGAGRMDELTRREGIVHYVGAVKPWHDEFPDNPLRHLYEHYATDVVRA